MITLSIIKSVLSNAFAWIVEHWPLVLFAVVLCAALYYKHEYNNAVADLATFKAEIATATAKQEADNAAKLATAKSNVSVAVNQAAGDMARLNLNRTKSTNDIKALYETKINQLKSAMAVSTGGLHTDAGNNPSGGAKVAGNTEEFAASPSDGYGANYSILEQACQITTIDYNELRGWADAVCGIAVCEGL
jgi:phage gp36-like protein